MSWNSRMFISDGLVFDQCRLRLAIGIVCHSLCGVEWMCWRSRSSHQYSAMITIAIKSANKDQCLTVVLVLSQIITSIYIIFFLSLPSVTMKTVINWCSFISNCRSCIGILLSSKTSCGMISSVSKRAIKSKCDVSDCVLLQQGIVKQVNYISVYIAAQNTIVIWFPPLHQTPLTTLQRLI